MMNSKKTVSFIIGIICTAALVVLDQLTKTIVCGTIKVTGPVTLIDGVFELRYLENTGAAWGMMSGAKVIFVIIAVVITVAVGWLYLKMPMDRKYIPARITFVLLVAGGLGNMIDRIVNGYVVDFFYFSLINFPIFNVADIYVTIAMGLVIILLLFIYKEQDLEFIKTGNTEKKK